MPAEPSSTGPAAEQPQPEESVAPAQAEPLCDAYGLVIDAMLALLENPRGEAWLAQSMCVRVAQVRDWLEKGVREGKITKLKKPVRYVRAQPLLELGARN